MTSLVPVETTPEPLRRIIFFLASAWFRVKEWKSKRVKAKSRIIFFIKVYTQHIPICILKTVMLGTKSIKESYKLELIDYMIYLK